MAKVGVDEWVARSEERNEGHTGPGAGLRRRWEATPQWGRLLVAVLIVAAVPLLTSSDFVIRVGINAMLLAMLAMGLNVVVGWAGLLDLGYIAFYGFGAYGYALLSSNQLGASGVHLPSFVSIPLVILAAAFVGLLLGLPSRRLLGDYLAILTLFFGQVFVELLVNLDRVKLPGASEPFSLTGGPNGIPGVDPIRILGYDLITPRSYYYLLLAVIVVLAVVLHLLDASRTGRAWRAVREDPMAAGFMTIPVNGVKLMAFSFGAAIAALAGTIFAAVQVGVFPQNFETPFLILIYAALILGGAGSIAGAALGGAVVGIILELLRNPDQASVLFYGLVLLALVVKLRPWRLLGVVLAGLVAFGLVLHAIAGAISADWVAGTPALGGVLRSLLEPWLVIPADAKTAGNVAFVALVVGVLALTTLRGRLRVLALVPLIYLAAFAWEARLVTEPSITRQLLVGTVLIVMMTLRPHGLLGSRRVEVV
ncbi:MAG: branched-chain amino acid ABC transporter permease [Solirubrobacterales bacterium]|nr:branched-chain amino acid ABC transporter permease [Solirubrobacterales bacterium]